MRYTNRSLRKRRNSKNKWEVIFTYSDPLTKEKSRRCFTVEADTQKGAEKARDALKFKLENEEIVSPMHSTVADYIDTWINRKVNELEVSTIKLFF